MPDPLVSIVTPSYNQGAFIRATIESVLSQDYSNLEYIIMDGGSTDETASVVKDYSSRLTWISERDRGQSHAINKGFKAAKGEIVSWLNSDDIILPGAVKVAARALDENSDAGAVYGEGYRLDKEGMVTGRFPFTEPFNLWKLVHLSDYILQQAVYFRRSVFDEVGFLDEDLHYVMDWDILIRIGLHRRLHYVPEYMGCIREYPEAKSFSGGHRRIQEIKRILRKHTGMRFPPGYIVYGLDTYRTIWPAWIQERTPVGLRIPSAKLCRLISRACRHWIGRTISHCQGWYSDGWATTTVRLMVPPGKGNAVILEGDIPSALIDPRSEVQLAIHFNDLPPTMITLKQGVFIEAVAVPHALKDRAIHVRVCTDSYFQPHRRGQPLDRRKLSFRLKSIRLEDATDRENGARSV